MSEQKEITEFLAKHPSPTYGEVCSKMEAYISAGDKYPAELRMMVLLGWMAEYGPANHGWCTTIRENLCDDSKCREMGTLIFEQGGMDALYANFYILKNFLCHEHPLRQSCHPCIFGGIGQWTAWAFS